MLIVVYIFKKHQHIKIDKSFTDTAAVLPQLLLQSTILQNPGKTAVLRCLTPHSSPVTQCA